MAKQRTEISSFSPLNDFINEAEDFLYHAKRTPAVTRAPELLKRVQNLEAALKHLTQKKHRTTKRDYQRAYDRYEHGEDGNIAVDLNGLRDETDCGGTWVSAFLYLPPTPAKRKSLTKGFKL